MPNYDSILKEEKKYEEPFVPVKAEGPPPFPKFKIAFILITIILIISYIAYYYIILTPDKIFLNDINILVNKYSPLLEPLKTSIPSDDYNIKGTIILNDNNYNYIFNKANTVTKFNLTLNDSSLNYYSKTNNNYLNVSTYDDNYYKINNDNYLDVIANLKDYFQNKIETEKFIKKVYIDNATPIVESNLVLNNEEITSSLGLNNQKDTYQVLFTFKNNAISNKIISMKIIVNNLTTGNRALIIYQNNYVTYKDDNNNLKFELVGNQDDFNLKIYKDDVMYSVLSGLKANDTYQYLYQVIDQIYNIILDINTETIVTTYKLTSNIETEGVIQEQIIDITMETNFDDMTESTDIDETLNYNSLTEEEKTRYDTDLDNLIGVLRQFIKECQH